jgi:hypothetical protein
MDSSSFDLDFTTSSNNTKKSSNPTNTNNSTTGKERDTLSDLSFPRLGMFGNASNNNNPTGASISSIAGNSAAPLYGSSSPSNRAGRMMIGQSNGQPVNTGYSLNLKASSGASGSSAANSKLPGFVSSSSNPSNSKSAYSSSSMPKFTTSAVNLSTNIPSSSVLPTVSSSQISPTNSSMLNRRRNPFAAAAASNIHFSGTNGAETGSSHSSSGNNSNKPSPVMFGRRVQQ